MSKTQLTYAALVLAMNSTAAERSEEVTLEGASTKTKMTFIPKFVGVVLGDNGEVERTPKVNEAFKALSSTYITVVINKSEGMLPKLLKKAIPQNAAPELYALLLKAANEMKENGGVFPSFDYTGKEIEVGTINFERPFYIPNKSTKSGWSEDSHGNPVEMTSRPFVYFPDFEEMQTIVRRELRNMEYNGHFVDSMKTNQIPSSNNNVTPIQTAPVQTADPANPGFDVNGAPMRKTA